MVGNRPMGSLRDSGRLPCRPPARPWPPTVTALVCLLLAACTGGSGEPAAPAAPSLRLTAVSVPLSCQAVPGVPEGCQVGGSGVAARARQGSLLPQRPAWPAPVRRLP